METAAAVEIDQGGLRRYFLEDFHRCLEKPRTTLGFSTVTTGSAAINQKPTTNKTGQITCYQNRTFLLATDRLFTRLFTTFNTSQLSTRRESSDVQNCERLSVYFFPLQERSAKYNKRDGKVDDQPRHVDKRCHKWRRGCGWIEPESLKKQRQHRSSERTPQDYSKKRKSHSGRDQEWIGPISR